MPFPDHVFRHTPTLRDRLTPPDASEMRFGYDRFDELDQRALAEGWPDGWRMDHDAREENRQKVLAGRMDSDLWVFAYGSLIWDPAVTVEEYRYATLPGWHRSFCMRLESGRGTHECPGLMAALDQGGSCAGLAFRIAAPVVDEETQYMWRREMFAGTYRPEFMQVATPQGPVEALVFVIDPTNRRYTPDLPLDVSAEMIGTAEGTLGTNFAYLDSLIHNLADLGIVDEAMQALHARARMIAATD
ncbi:ChaC-like protein [Sulfitobacter noctilucae]|uniref:gamma-glutamylcyclotransferase n=1 Tax=Sulfitobacter noctilucae TaxID=1342302 RepID=UPI000569D2DC|nr:gamma-glutamylcyclotransferase [Sulfitobacter noctilucae]KIN60837.1 ChaC-like protein [Sulfitobacter noctilucae]